ncbi:hypothetical protein M9H77_02615 [Catharanthus roseus]|uniref:Uncharacterized protein n=1 Tax=Catharanthus roseus TaxID=4058 RepID=A0ACC0C9E0_CATRO|nr:hypothetical protein M9H77_02615 [Catharanthus roseus]
MRNLCNESDAAKAKKVKLRSPNSGLYVMKPTTITTLVTVPCVPFSWNDCNSKAFKRLRQIPLPLPHIYVLIQSKKATKLRAISIENIKLTDHIQTVRIGGMPNPRNRENQFDMLKPYSDRHNKLRTRQRSPS